MNIRRIAALLLGLIVIVFSNALVISLDTSSVAAAAIDLEFTPRQREIIGQLQQTTVIYLGEIHDRSILAVPRVMNYEL